MIHTCQCECGNMTVSGCVMRQKDVQAVFSNQKPLTGSKSSHSLEVRRNAVRIKDWNKIDMTSYKQDSVTVVCRKCLHSITINFMNSHFYAFYDSRQHVGSTRRQSMPIQDQIRTYIRNSKFNDLFQITDQETEMDNSPCAESNDLKNELTLDDSDFEYMFSATSIPFVGSFTDRFIDSPPDSLLV